jgi:HD superfamily phosphodiesterase
MVKATEDAIHSVLQSDDNRVIKCTAQKFNNPEMIQEMIIFTMQPYIGSLSIFDLETAPNEDRITSDNERLCKKYLKEIESVCTYCKVVRQPLYDPDHPIDIGYIANRELLSIAHIDDMTAFLRTLKFLGITLRVVTPKRSQWIRMIAPNGQVCEMYDSEIRDRFSEGYIFGEYNYIEVCD